MIEIRWQDTERRILRYTFPERWCWDDFYAVKKEADAWLDDTSYHDDDVLLIINMRGSRLDNVIMDMLTHAKQLFRAAHPRANPILVISTHSSVHNLAPLVRRLVPRFNQGNLCVVKTEREAQIIIDQILTVEA